MPGYDLANFPQLVLAWSQADINDSPRLPSDWSPLEYELLECAESPWSRMSIHFGPRLSGGFLSDLSGVDVPVLGISLQMEVGPRLSRYADSLPPGFAERIARELEDGGIPGPIKFSKFCEIEWCCMMFPFWEPLCKNDWDIGCNSSIGCRANSTEWHSFGVWTPWCFMFFAVRNRCLGHKICKRLDGVLMLYVLIMLIVYNVPCSNCVGSHSACCSVHGMVPVFLENDRGRPNSKKRTSLASNFDDDSYDYTILINIIHVFINSIDYYCMFTIIYYY